MAALALLPTVVLPTSASMSPKEASQFDGPPPPPAATVAIADVTCIVPRCGGETCEALGPAAPTHLLGIGGGGGKGTFGSAVKEEPGVWQMDASSSAAIKAEAPSGATAAAKPPPASTPAPSPAPVPFSSVLALEALLRRAVALVVPLLPPPAPRFLVEDWLDRWEGCLRELEAHLDMRVVTEGCCFQRHLVAAVESGEAGNCESMLRMILLLP